MKIKFLLVLLCTTLHCLSYGQNIDTSKLNAYLEALETHNKFMGNVTVSKGGELIYAKSMGYSDVEKKLRAQPKSIYRIGSISKTFTAVLTLKAIEENKIQLNQKLDAFYPTIKNSNKITIEQLLYQRTGIHSFTDEEDYLEWNTEKKTEEELIQIISKGESEFEPNSQYAYSNPNYILLSFIIQKVYNQPYSEILKKKITSPLGLHDTYFGKKINPENQECYSYSFAQTWEKEKETDTSIPVGAGGVISTSFDLVRFAEGLFAEKLITRKSLDQMTKMIDGYGMGIFELPFHDLIGYGHTGAIDGFSSMFIYLPDSKVGFAMVSNGTNYSNNSIAMSILSSVFNKPYEIPQFSVYQVTEGELEKYVGNYRTDDLPLKLTISKEGTKLVAQATGQQSLILEATEKHTFTFDRAGIVMVFDPEKKSLLLKQGGGEYAFVKE